MKKKILKGTKLEGTRIDQSNTPRFWKRVRNWSLLIGAVAGAIATGGAALPATVVTIATIVGSTSGAIAGFAATRKEKQKS